MEILYQARFRHITRCKPTIGDAVRPIEPEDIRRADRMMYAESLLALALGLLIRGIL